MAGEGEGQSEGEREERVAGGSRSPQTEHMAL